MSEIRRPQPEMPWEEPIKTLNAFTSKIDDLFIVHFNDVDRGIVQDDRLSEQLVLKNEKDGSSFTLVRGLYRDPDTPIDYGLHIKEKGNDYLYRIKSGLVHKLSPSYGGNILDIDIHNYAAGIDPEQLHERPANLQDVEQRLERALEAKPQPITFRHLVTTHRSTLDHQEQFFNDLVNSALVKDTDNNYINDDEEFEKNEHEYAQMAANFFNNSVDEIMDSNKKNIKKEYDTEVLEIMKRDEQGTLAINLARDKYGDYVDDRKIIMVYQSVNNTSTQMTFQVGKEALQSSKLENAHRENSVSHALMDPNDARNLIRFIRNPKI